MTTSRLPSSPRQEAKHNSVEEDDDDKPSNPFLDIEVEEWNASDKEGKLNHRGNIPSKTVRGRRKWGIPDFSDQMDRGISTFTLQRSSTASSVTMQLEFRRNSTGSDLWDAALVLAHALERPGVVVPASAVFDPPGASIDNSQLIAKPLAGQRVLELGSGTGAVGLFCAQCLGAEHVTLTDLPANLDLLRHNVTLNHLDNQVEVQELDWTCPNLPDDLEYDLFIGSDLFLPFAPHLLPALVQTLERLLSRQRQATALICYEERFDCSKFFEATRKNLDVVTVANELLHPVYQDAGRIHLLRIVMKK